MNDKDVQYQVRSVLCGKQTARNLHSGLIRRKKRLFPICCTSVRVCLSCLKQEYTVFLYTSVYIERDKVCHNSYDIPKSVSVRQHQIAHFVKTFDILIRRSTRISSAV